MSLQYGDGVERCLSLRVQLYRTARHHWAPLHRRPLALGAEVPVVLAQALGIECGGPVGTPERRHFTADRFI